MPYRNRIACAVCLAALSVATAMAFAATELPPPTGPYAVGRTLAYAKDDDRPEIWTEDPADRREIVLFIWYPVDLGSKEPLASYLPYPDDRIRGPLVYQRARGRVLITHTRADIPVAKGAEKFPLLFFSGGSGAIPAMYHSIIEDLVSHGYVVVGLDHLYEGAGQIMADGRLITPIVDGLTPPRDPESPEVHKVYREFYYRRVNERVLDGTLALRMLKMMNRHREGRFYDRLDFDRMGFYGHSLGGNTAAHALTDFPELKAAVNIDGFADGMPFNDRHTPMKPFMCIETAPPDYTDEEFARRNMTRERYEAIERAFDERMAAIYNQNPTVAYRVSISKADHLSFSDSPYLAPEKDGLTLVDHVRTTNIARQYLLAFFDEALRGRPSPLLRSVPEDLRGFVRAEAFGGAVQE